jgi:hypothetical protein
MLNKKIIIFVSLTILAMLAATFFYYKNNFKIFTAHPAEKTNNKPSSGKEALIKDCSGLTGRENDLCLKTKAQVSFDQAICEQIGDSSIKTDCLQEIEIKLAVEKKNLVGCEQIGNLMLSKSCLTKVIKDNYELADCGFIRIGSLAAYCQSEKYGLLARKNKDARLCEKIPEAIKRANCLSELKHIDLHSDADKDGLDFLQETIDGTDPNKTDTDGDGFNDSQETKSGFNPDGPGKTLPVSANLITCSSIDDYRLRDTCLNEYKQEGKIDLLKCQDIKNQDLFFYCYEKLKKYLQAIGVNNQINK